MMRRLSFLALTLLLVGSWPIYAGRTFADGQYLEVGSALVSTPPFTFCTWFRTTASTAGQGIMGIGTAATDDHRHELNIETTGVLQARSRSVFPTVGTAVGAAVTQGVWQHVCGVWASTTSRSVYLNGGSKATDTTSVAPTGMNRTWIARMTGGAPNIEFNGDLGSAAIWNVALTDGEVAALSVGVLPRKVRSGSLVSFLPLWGFALPEPDLAAARTWPATGSPTLAGTHPPVGLFSLSFGR